MGTYFQKQAAADRLYKLACAARVIKRARAVQRLTKRAADTDVGSRISADETVALPDPTDNNDSKSKGSLLAALKALATNPYTIGGTAGSLAGSGIGALLAPKDKRLLYALLGSGIGTGLGVGGAAGYNALKKVK